jgi:hypothetical protein
MVNEEVIAQPESYNFRNKDALARRCHMLARSGGASLNNVVLRHTGSMKEMQRRLGLVNFSQRNQLTPLGNTSTR